jgi:hypothetical protein
MFANMISYLVPVLDGLQPILVSQDLELTLYGVRKADGQPPAFLISYQFLINLATTRPSAGHQSSALSSEIFFHDEAE